MRPNFLQEIQKGQQGLNQGLPNCFDRFNKYLYGTQKRTYYAVGGLPGSGKSAFVDDNFLLSPYFELKDKGLPTSHIHWHYYSFELDYLSKRARWTAYRLYQKFGILLDSNFLLGKGIEKGAPVGPQHIAYHKDLDQKIQYVTQEIDDLFKHITFVDDVMNPTGIYRELMAYANDKGTFIYEEYDIIEDHTKPEEKKKGKRIVDYELNNPEDINLVIVDHMALAKRERSYSQKENIDKLSEYFIFLRNKCSYIPIAVVQFNKALTGIERIKFKKELLLPTLEDFKDTGNIGQDCNTAFGMFNPFKMDFEDHLGYPILPRIRGGNRPAFEDKFRAINIMKNRDGEEWRHMGMHYLGGLGRLRELPMPGLFDSGIAKVNDYLIKPINELNNVANTN
jgi:hypothetical protein